MGTVKRSAFLDLMLVRRSRRTCILLSLIRPFTMSLLQHYVKRAATCLKSKDKSTLNM